MSDSDVTYCNSRLKGNGDELEKREPGPEFAGEGYCSTPTGGGRCRMHGRNAGRPVEHGLHAELKEDLRRYVDQAASMDAPGSLEGELAVLRGLLYRRLKDSEELDSSLVNDAHKLLSELRRTSDTIHKQMQRERPSSAEVDRIVKGMGSILKRYLDDEEQREAALAELRSLTGTETA